MLDRSDVVDPEHALTLIADRAFRRERGGQGIVVTTANPEPLATAAAFLRILSFPLRRVRIDWSHHMIEEPSVLAGPAVLHSWTFELNEPAKRTLAALEVDPAAHPGLAAAMGVTRFVLLFDPDLRWLEFRFPDKDCARPDCGRCRAWARWIEHKRRYWDAF